ncbi:MAG TPA: hypothetical protein VJM32_04250 [Candidatus Saccharimonadales bacterium]|nr:hypothetical protein [Candidatus Saccharimonadales bacterium]
MAELWRPHPLTRDHDQALAGELWLHFVDRFPIHDATPLVGKAKLERQLARQALDTAANPAMRRQALFQARFEQLYTGRFKESGFVESTWGREMIPFLQYFDAARRGENTAFHREGIYGSYLALLGDVRSQFARSRDMRADTKTLGELRGRATELIAGTLIARLRHPNITLIPSLALQDNFGIAADNHDYLYIDTFGEDPIVQPTQIKTRLNNATDRHDYFDYIAMIYGDLDLHVCPYSPTPCKPGRSLDCLLNKTADYILEENSPNKTATLDTLTANMLIKLSTWDEHKEDWRSAIEEHRISRFGRDAIKRGGTVTFPGSDA